MPRPIHNDLPGYDHEVGIDLTTADLARLDAYTTQEARIARLHRTEAQERIQNRVGVLAILLLILSCALGPTIDHEPVRYEFGPRMARVIGGAR